MMPMDWAWLAVTLVQVLGLSIALAALGFAYERVVQKRVLFADRSPAGEASWLAGVGSGAGGGRDGVQWRQPCAKRICPGAGRLPGLDGQIGLTFDDQRDQHGEVQKS